MNLRDKFLGKIENENFHSFNSNEVFANGSQWENANAQAAASQPSQAFIVKLTNGFASTVSDVVFLDAMNSVDETNDGVTTGVTATYDLPGMNYGQFLRWLMTKSSRIGMIRTISDTAANLRSTFKITTYNITGEDFSKVIQPKLNLFQYISTGIETNVDFYLTGTTKITYSSLAAGSNITFEFYPSAVESSIANVAGGRKYADPQISGVKQITNPAVTKLT